MSSPAETELKKHQDKITLFGAIGMPFFISFALGSLATFKGKAIIPALNNESIALAALIIGALGAAITSGIAFYHVQKTKALQVENT